MNNDLLLLLTAFLGTFVHWVVLKSKKQVTGNMIDYLTTNPANTIMMVTSVISAVGGMAVGLDLTSASPWLVAMTGFNGGYALDNIFNKGPKQDDIPA